MADIRLFERTLAQNVTWNKARINFLTCAEQLSLAKQEVKQSDEEIYFEKTGLRRLTFAPAVPINRKGTQELVRSDTEKAQNMGIAFDAELLPAQLRFVVASSTPKSKYWLARRVRAGEIETLNRSAAYFQ